MFMKKNNTTDTTQTISKAEKKRLAQYKEKKTPWIEKAQIRANAWLLCIILCVSIGVWLVAMCTGLGIANSQHIVKDTEGRGLIYTAEAVVVATDNTLHTVRDTEGTLWLIDNDTLTKGDTLLLYIADNKTDTQTDDVIVRVWRDTTQ